MGTDSPTAAFGNVIVQRSWRLRRRRTAGDLRRGPGHRSLRRPGNQAPWPFRWQMPRRWCNSSSQRTAGLYHWNEVRLLVNEEVTPAGWKKAIGGASRQAEGPGRGRRPAGVLPGRAMASWMKRRRSTTSWATILRWPIWATGFTRIAFAGMISPCWPTCLAARWPSWTPATAARSSRCGRGDLKTAVRELQADVIFTVTASTGEQLAAESADWRHGVFTRCLLDALERQGRARSATARQWLRSTRSFPT